MQYNGIDKETLHYSSERNDQFSFGTNVPWSHELINDSLDPGGPEHRNRYSIDAISLP